MCGLHRASEATGPMTRPALWLAFGLGLLATALSSYALLNGQVVDGGWSFFVIGLTPIITGIGAALLTSRAIAEVEMTQPAQYYLFKALRRFRYLLVLVIALMPWWVLSQLDQWLR